MDQNEIIAKLDQLAVYRGDRAQIEREKALRLAEAIPPEVQTALDAVKAEFDIPLSVSAEITGELEAEIKDAILELQSSVKGLKLHAVWAKGRTTWNSDGLEGYALAHPELLNFQKIGQPSVSIREIKGG
jgi:hypothetical protein